MDEKYRYCTHRLYFSQTSLLPFQSMDLREWSYESICHLFCHGNSKNIIAFFISIPVYDFWTSVLTSCFIICCTTFIMKVQFEVNALIDWNNYISLWGHRLTVIEGLFLNGYEYSLKFVSFMGLAAFSFPVLFLDYRHYIDPFLQLI